MTLRGGLQPQAASTITSWFGQLPTRSVSAENATSRPSGEMSYDADEYSRFDSEKPDCRVIAAISPLPSAAIENRCGSRSSSRWF